MHTSVSWLVLTVGEDEQELRTQFIQNSVSQGKTRGHCFEFERTVGYTCLLRNFQSILNKVIHRLPEDLIGAHDDRLLTVLHVVLDL